MRLDSIVAGHYLAYPRGYQRQATSLTIYLKQRPKPFERETEPVA